MKNIRTIITIICLMTATGAMALSGPKDSIGTKVKNGKIFIMHQVEKSQGLFSISRRYGVSLNEIILANPGSDQLLRVDQVLLIPTGKDAPMEETAVKEYFSGEKVTTPSSAQGTQKKSTFARYHTVAKGETLYSISMLYSTKVDVLKNLNGLETDVLTVGQQIMVPASEEEKEDHDNAMIEAQQQVDVSKAKSHKLRKRIDPKDDDVAEKKIEPVSTDAYEVKVERLPKYDVEKVSERGMVETFDMANRNASNYRVCSHHTARIGSTIMVTNRENSKSVFVKVVSNHELDKKTGNIIRLSPTAMTDIEIQDRQKVEVSFAR
ncbi:MAG: LysM peptidoglycan-binding domain-containing protein [Bacteroidia bacterium]|nr:LysM peptidoglycan-binding domain-containing protein [Bacteroidia bacterium]